MDSSPSTTAFNTVVIVSLTLRWPESVIWTLFYVSIRSSIFLRLNMEIAHTLPGYGHVPWYSRAYSVSLFVEFSQSCKVSKKGVILDDGEEKRKRCWRLGIRLKETNCWTYRVRAKDALNYMDKYKDFGLRSDIKPKYVSPKTESEVYLTFRCSKKRDSSRSSRWSFMFAGS